MEPNRQRLLFRFSLIVPSILLIGGPITLYLYREFLFTEKFYMNGVYFLAGLIPATLLLITLPYYLFKKGISKKPVKLFAGFLQTILTIIGIGAIVVGFGLSSLYIGIDHYNVGPVLTWSTYQDPASEITVMWRTSNQEASIVYYGEDAMNLSESAKVTGTAEWHRVPLTGLKPDTKYYYRVQGLAENHIHSFITAPLVEKNFTFLVFSDPRQNTSPLNIVLTQNIPKIMMQTMSRQGTRSAFTIMCGDITTFATTEESWKSWFNDISESGLGSDAALQVSIGNHEREYNHTGEIFASKYPYIGHPEFYYAYNYSSVHVQVLDPWNFTLGSYWDAFSPTQLAWIEQDLKNAQEMKYKIIALHPPIVYNNAPLKLYEPLIKLCDDYGVDAVFFGHVHDFATNKINNTHYFLIGVGGNSFIGPTGFVQVDVTSEKMHINMNWINGTSQFLARILA